MTRRLIVISGSGCVGKTSVAEKLWETLDNASWVDADRLWWVRMPARPGEGTPYFLDAVAYLINQHFAFGLDTIILTWWFPRIDFLTEISNKIEHEHALSHFMLTAEPATLLERHRLRGDARPYENWMTTDANGRLPCTVEICTENRTVAQVSGEIGQRL